MRDLHNSSTRYIMKLSSAVRSALDSFSENTSISPMETRALLFIATSKEAIYQKDIEQEYRLSRATVSELMQSMEQKGMICRTRDSADRRKNRISICRVIQPVVNDMIAGMNAIEDKMASGIDEEDMAVFLRVIRQMLQNTLSDNELNRNE